MSPCGDIVVWSPVPPQHSTHDTISPDSNEPVQTICTSPVPPNHSPHSTINGLLPWMWWAHTAISLYVYTPNHESMWTICVSTVTPKSSAHDAIGAGSNGPIVMFLDYSYTYHTQIIIGTASFSLSQSLHKALTLTLVPLHHDLCYHCTIQSDSSLSVRYNLLQVQLSLGDAYRPLLSFTYTSIYVEEYINCTTRTLRP